MADRSGRLADQFGRVATDLRVSLTDRCNLRCTYCMPPEGLPWLPGPDVLTDGEVVRLVRVAVHRLGVTDVRFTGGEPLLRRGLVSIVAQTAALTPRPKVSLTTNGIGLDRLAVPLRDVGLDRVNVSLDTLDADRFARLTHRPRLPDVLAGLRAGQPGQTLRRHAVGAAQVAPVGERHPQVGGHPAVPIHQAGGRVGGLGQEGDRHRSTVARQPASAVLAEATTASRYARPNSAACTSSRWSWCIGIRAAQPSASGHASR